MDRSGSIRRKPQRKPGSRLSRKISEKGIGWTSTTPFLRSGSPGHRSTQTRATGGYLFCAELVPGETVSFSREQPKRSRILPGQSEEPEDATEEQGEGNSRPILDEAVTPVPEMKEKEAAALVEARNSVVAAWLWRKFAATTHLAENEIVLNPCCAIWRQLPERSTLQAVHIKSRRYSSGQSAKTLERITCISQ